MDEEDPETLTPNIPCFRNLRVDLGGLNVLVGLTCSPITVIYAVETVFDASGTSPAAAMMFIYPDFEPWMLFTGKDHSYWIHRLR
ncbi:hypothetical protein E1B28_007993 [Marasmius oreades]|uniref:Uncharacterized protein n=1 Tax=Marasmius oreades TaxID=181124 RepID=A0A9P7S4L7_9AGAR|nr:uncharacterized protein E1B28_007993 [Marasmius oreades]KAG7094393.1 hypothetical protein E1B28_007993 [Marasmius oreades]